MRTGEASNNSSSNEGAALGNINGDLTLDAFIVSYYGSPAGVWFGDGSGHFTNSNQSLDNGGSSDVDLGDLDGDADLEALIANRYEIMAGYAKGAPYAGIIAAAGGDAVPPAWIEQLAVGGRIVAPTVMNDGKQALVVLEKTPREMKQTVLEAVHFVPLKSGVA